MEKPKKKRSIYDIIADELYDGSDEIENAYYDLEDDILRSENCEEILMGRTIFETRNFSIYFEFDGEIDRKFENCVTFELRTSWRVTKFNFDRFFKFLDAICEFDEIVDDDELF